MLGAASERKGKGWARLKGRGGKGRHKIMGRQRTTLREGEGVKEALTKAVT